MPPKDLLPDAQADWPEPVRYAGISKSARSILETQGESGRFEFKATSKAVDVPVLVAAANWVALDPDRGHVTLLVGVEEILDSDTGLTTGRPVRMSGADLSTHVRRIQSVAATTRPVPVDLRIIEEGTSTATPFLRVEVRPTFPPHFDGSGRRVTRYGASTRPLEDEELLDIYLDREARKFEARFERTAQRTIEAVGEIGSGLDGMALTLERLPGLIDGAESAASTAGYEAEDTQRRIEDVADQLRRLERRLAERLNRTPDHVLLRLQYIYIRTWRCFNVDRVLRPSKAAERLAPRLIAHLNEPLSVADYLLNVWRLEQWESALETRNRPASMRWWQQQLKTAMDVPSDVGQLRLADDIEGFVQQYDDAETYEDVELLHWGESDW